MQTLFEATLNFLWVPALLLSILPTDLLWQHSGTTSHPLPFSDSSRLWVHKGTVVSIKVKLKLDAKCKEQPFILHFERMTVLSTAASGAWVQQLKILASTLVPWQPKRAANTQQKGVLCLWPTPKLYSQQTYCHTTQQFKSLMDLLYGHVHSSPGTAISLQPW